MLPLTVCACSRVPGKLLVMEGNFHHARGKYAEAIESYMKALEYEETAPYSEYGLGSAYFAMGEEKAALQRYSEAGNMSEALPADTGKEIRYRIHYNTGVVLFSEGNFSGAVDSFREALKIDGGRQEAKRNLELSIRSLARDTMPAGSGNSAESESMEALFEYIRQKEFNQWKSREWESEDEAEGPDY
jgi:Ca-activated chloride channel family protein